MDFNIVDHEVTLSDLDNFNYSNQKIGVIVHIENKDGGILLQQRGIKSRDENGLYEDIGGRVESSDISFKDAIIRELEEEAGTDIKLEIGDSIGIYHCFKNNINWLFIIYFGRYLSGEFMIMEPDKCMGYKFFKYEDAINSDKVSESCKFLIKQIGKINQ